MTTFTQMREMNEHERIRQIETIKIRKGYSPQIVISQRIEGVDTAMLVERDPKKVWHRYNEQTTEWQPTYEKSVINAGNRAISKNIQEIRIKAKPVPRIKAVVNKQPTLGEEIFSPQGKTMGSTMMPTAKPKVVTKPAKKSGKATKKSKEKEDEGEEKEEEEIQGQNNQEKVQDKQESDVDKMNIIEFLEFLKSDFIYRTYGRFIK
jgi:hypothetical protein